MRSTQKRRCRSNRGFTLVEMIVTMMLLSILLTISVMGLLAWQDWSDFNQANEYAETMFLSAQNQLSEYNANGTLADFAEDVQKTGCETLDLSQIYYKEGQAYTEDSVWVTKDKGTLVSVRANKGDYSRYAAGKDTTSPTAPIVFRLLESYLYDTSILNDAIAVEFSLEDGQVFSVLYCGKADGDDQELFVYEGSENSLRGKVNIASRYESYRKDRMLGYYGVDTLSKALTTEKAKPKIKVELHNEDTLNLTIRPENMVNAAQQLNYEVTVYDLDPDFCDSENKANGVPVLKFTLRGSDIKNEAAVKNMISSNRYSDVPTYSFTRYMKQDGTWVTQDIGEFPVLSWIETDGTIRVILDAADLQATAKNYALNLSTLKDADKAERIKNSDFKFKTTYSFHRFGLDATYIKCSVKASGTQYAASVETDSNNSYVYFADENHNTDEEKKVVNYNYSIANARHLYNMRYITDLTANTNGTTTDELRLSNAHYGQKVIDRNKKIACHFQLTGDIDWAKFVEDGQYFDTKGNGIKVSGDGISEEESKALASAFVSMRQLRAEDSLDGGKDDAGDPHTIRNLTVSQAANVLGWVYANGTDESNSGNQNTTGDNSDDKKMPVGLVATNYGTIQNLKLEAVQVTSPGDYVGAFAGMTVCGTDADGTATGVLKNLEVVCKNPNDEKASYVKGSSYVGGIVGKLEGTEKDGTAFNVEWSKLVNAAKVTGKAYVGGIVGELRTDAARKSSITLSECENYGAVYAVLKKSDEKKDSKFIGGIVGLSANLYGAKNPDAQNCITIKDCVSTPVYGDDDAKQFLGANNGEAFANYGDTIVGNYVGGIAGYSYYSTLEHVRGSKKSQDEVQQTGYVFGDSYVGGITGYYVGTQPLAGQDTDGTAGRNENYVIGCSYVGGITGASADIDETETRNASGVANAATEDILTIIEKSQTVQTVSDETGKTTVANWNNAGVVYATTQYAGGISGYNTGTIRESVNTVGTVTVTGTYPVDHAADYVGGITGYNHGVITAANQINNQVQIAGKNYVGGVVGYNEAGAEVTNYAVSSGSIQGDTKNGSYIGGLAGCNASINMLQNADGSAKKLYVNTQDISGKYFVGGVIGANIINTNGYTGNRTTEVGESDGKNYADGTSAGQTTSKCYVELRERTTGVYTPSKEYNFYIHNESDKPMKNWHLEFSVPKGTTFILNWGGTSEAEDIGDTTIIKFYPQHDTTVPAETTTSNWSFQMNFPSYRDLYSFDVSDISLFYEGGDDNQSITLPGNMAITEKNRHEVSVNDNTYQVQYVTSQEYWKWDGTQAVNRFVINGFTIKNMGDKDLIDWSIEIPVLNDTLEVLPQEWDGLECEYFTKNQNGKEQQYLRLTPKPIGFKTIAKNTSLNNGSTVAIKIRMETDAHFQEMLEQTRFIFYTTELTSKTDDLEYYRIKASADMKDFTGNITGSAFTGGAIGYTLLADSTDKKYAYNKAEELRKTVAGAGSVDDAAKAVCDATGNNTSEVQMYVTGTVGNAKATGAGKVTGGTYVGGIVGYNDANTFMYIDQAASYASVTADTGYAGGIISANRKSNNKIQTSNFYGSVTAKEAAGGIAGENQGTISECNVTNATITGGNGTSVASYGGIAGVNGIASTKTGEVDAAKITECTFSGTVTGASGNQNVRAHIGGIVGANGFNSTVKASTIGAQETLVSAKEQAGTIANVGGIAGTNYGTVESSDNKAKAADAQTTIKNESGYTGGIVGCSQKDAVVKGTDTEKTTTSDKWTIIVNTSDKNVDTAVGGIIGHSESGTALELMENNATVNVTGGNASVGGIVGKLESGTGNKLTINKCDNYGAVTGTWYTGGLVGYLRNAATFTSCESKGEVTGGAIDTTGIMVGFVDSGLENDVTCSSCTVPDGMNMYSFRPTATLADTMSGNSQVVMEEDTEAAADTEDTESVADTETIADAADTAAKQDAESTEPVTVVEQLPTPDAEQLAEETWVPQYYDGTEWSLQKPANDAEQGKNTTDAQSGEAQEKMSGSYKTRAYTFDIQEHVDLYEVQMQDAGGAYGMLYIQPKKAKAYVYYAGSFADVRRESICDANPYSEFAGILTEENPVSASYAVNVSLDDKNTVVLPAVVTMKGETISVLLPDTTTYVSVQATVEEEHVDKYENSDIAVWRYILEEDATTTDAVAIGEADESGKVVWSGVLKDEARATEVPDIAGTSVQIGSGATAQNVVNYTVAVTQPMLVNILAYDADGNLMKSAYYTVSKDAASFMLETKNWFEKSDDVRIQYSEIGDTGLGDWTESVQLTESGFKN